MPRPKLTEQKIDQMRQRILDAAIDIVRSEGPEKLSIRAIAGGRVCTHQGLTRHFGMSSNARGLTENDLTGKPAEFATPSVLLRLAKAHDRMFTY